MSPAGSAREVFVPGAEGVNAYRLLTALVVPRPIAWVSTVSAEGIGNLAPHSFFTVASARPPIVQFTSVGTKDTLRNVLATREFVVNVASLPMLEQVNASSAPFEPGVDEATAVGISMEPSEHVSPRRVVESPASIECTLHSVVELGESTVVLGDVVAITVCGDVLEDGHPALRHLAPLSRLGSDEWGLPPEVISVERPRRRP
jgi:flavin reductase (DIM6/NTAB) family NADH-FMN oxidoreductase RutF